jgi:hypothetical protein
VLAARLAALVEAGLLERHEYQPGRHEYRITQAGIELWPAVHALMSWGERHRSAGERRRLFVHVACGTEIDPTGACPRCGTRPDPGELEICPGPALRHRRDDPVSRALRTPHRMLTPLPTPTR